MNNSDWLADAKKRAKELAANVYDDMIYMADEINVDSEWFAEEVIKYLNCMKKNWR